jgi:transposase-like protein
MTNENLVKYWRKQCVDKGTSLAQICREVGIEREVLTRWEKAEPKSIRLMRAINEAIEKK